MHCKVRVVDKKGGDLNLLKKIKTEVSIKLLFIGPYSKSYNMSQTYTHKE